MFEIHPKGFGFQPLVLFFFFNHANEFCKHVIFHEHVNVFPSIYLPNSMLCSLHFYFFFSNFECELRVFRSLTLLLSMSFSFYCYVVLCECTIAQYLLFLRYFVLFLTRSYFLILVLLPFSLSLSISQ